MLKHSGVKKFFEGSVLCFSDLLKRLYARPLVGEFIACYFPADAYDLGHCILEVSEGEIECPGISTFGALGVDLADEFVDVVRSKIRPCVSDDAVCLRRLSSDSAPADC